MADVDVTLDSVPHADPEQPLPESVHVAPALAGSFETVAVNACDPLIFTVGDGGSIEIEMVGGVVMVIEDVSDLVASEIDVAVIVALAGFGADAGAAYFADVDVTALSVPQVAPEQPLPERVHVTPLFAESFDTVAVNVCVPLVFTVADAGVRETEIGIAMPVAG